MKKSICWSLVTFSILSVTEGSTFAQSSYEQKSQLQVGRYLSVNEGPTKAQINPLLAVSVFKFNTSVYTVGDAVKIVLANTGYVLSKNLSKSAAQTLDKPLPLTDRKLGPMKIQTALEVLMGKDVFVLQRDPLHRLVNFKIKPSIVRALGVKKNA